MIVPFPCSPRPSVRCTVRGELMVALTGGEVLVLHDEFEAWYRLNPEGRAVALVCR